MACISCHSKGGCGSAVNLSKEIVSGCQSNGSCGTKSCNKMNIFDWIVPMEIPTFQQFNCVEVKFKGGHKDYFRNTSKLELFNGDAVVVEMPSGYHVGVVSAMGEIVRLQLLKKRKKENEITRTIYRKANSRDLEKHQESIARDSPTLYRVREITKELKLKMKMSDVEFQSDNTKAIFYYSAEDKIDFRELIKFLATEFKVKVEMRQINLRQEASRLGGVGMCGRELCCSTWLTDYKNINNSAARYQNLSLNPVKLAGQCGRLKCCLNYELETYITELKDIPEIESPLLTQKGKAVLQKIDIFRKIMWFCYEKESIWVSVPVTRVNEIIELNKREILPESLEQLEATPKREGGYLNKETEQLDKKIRNKNYKHSNSKPSSNRNHPNTRPK